MPNRFATDLASDPTETHEGFRGADRAVLTIHYWLCAVAWYVEGENAGRFFVAYSQSTHEQSVYH